MRVPRTLIAKTAGAIVALGIVYAPLALAAAGFPCAIQFGPTSCVACSGCTTDENGRLRCGTIERAAQCADGFRARCEVGTDGGTGNVTYFATCDPVQS